MYELSGPPFKTDKRDPDYLVDASGERIQLLGHSRQILHQLATEERWRDTAIAYVSRTEYPRWAAACLNLFHVAPGISMHALGTEQEIYPGSKTLHFRRIHERTGIDYEHMLFFDNESWNVSDVAPLGVVSVHCPRGMTKEIWEKGLGAYALKTCSKDSKKTQKPFWNTQRGHGSER